MAKKLTGKEAVKKMHEIAKGFKTKKKKRTKKLDRRVNATKQSKGRIIHPTHIHSDYLEYWLEQFTLDGNTLNICSGDSLFGLVRVDIDPESNRTVDGDLFKISNQFKPESFKYVYCDPPFQFYTSGENRFRWQYDLFKLVKPGGALITRRPKVTINMPSKYHDYIIAEDSRPSFTVLRIDYK